jgi:hypothetical protein
VRGDGTTTEWKSKKLPAYRRRTKEVEALIAGSYLSGTNTRVHWIPAASTIAAALVEIDAGGMRELHWHPNTDERQYYISGQGRMIVFASGGKAQTFNFQSGYVGYASFAWATMSRIPVMRRCVILKCSAVPISPICRSINGWR